MRNGRVPHIGMRNIKTACAAALCVLLYYFISRIPTFACIGAIFGMGNDLQSSKLHGGNCLFGTIIGGILVKTPLQSEPLWFGLQWCFCYKPSNYAVFRTIRLYFQTGQKIKKA